jgi:hypothetical protein
MKVGVFTPTSYEIRKVIMPLGRGKSGSEVKYIVGLSNLAVAAAGSSNPVNLKDSGFVNVLVAADSDDLVVNVERSATSNGTFNQIGCSLQSVASGLAVRSFRMGSPNWVKVSYDNGNAGSINAVILLEAQEMRQTPVNQETNVTVYSTILNP